MRFVVTGCSRSGTLYTARLLTAAGIPCGHEQVFSPWSGALHLSEPFAMRPDLRGDSSFMAAPYLDRLRAGDWVLHQVRDPIDVIRSHVGMKFFAEPFVQSKELAGDHPYYVAIIKDFTPDVFTTPDETARSARYWVQWNEAIERSAGELGLRYVRYRIEALDVDLLRDLAGLLECSLDRAALEAAFRRPKTTLNTRARDESISWDAIVRASGSQALELAALAERYGYAVPVRA